MISLSAGRRALVIVSLLMLPLTAATCSSEGAQTDCAINSCTVTFDRGVDASASILGIKAKLVDVQGDNVTLEIGGQRVTIPAEGRQQVGDATVQVQSVTKDNVVVKISTAGGGG
jgi:hypothetical protein